MKRFNYSGNRQRQSNSNGFEDLDVSQIEPTAVLPLSCILTCRLQAGSNLNLGGGRRKVKELAVTDDR